MSENTERLRGHVASYKWSSPHRKNCLDVCDEVERLTAENKSQREIQYKYADEINRLIKNGQAMLKTIETIQAIRMADEAAIERLTDEVRDAFISGHQAADVHITNDESIAAYAAWKSTVS